MIDTRPEVECQAGHLPGAKSYPVVTLCYRIDEIPFGKTLVTYCWGPYCSEADEVLTLLSAYGYPVKRLEEGVVEWHEAGFQLGIDNRIGSLRLCFVGLPARYHFR